MPSSLIIGVVDQIVRHQIDRTFDALECAADGAGEGPQHRGLADGDIAFEQHVAPSKYGDVEGVYDAIVADDCFLDFRFQRQGAGAPILQ